MDPSVRDDGDLEPDLQLASEAAADDATPHASLRDKLLARADAARQAAQVAEDGPVRGGLDEIGRPAEPPPASHQGREGELDALGAPSTPSGPFGFDQPRLSPTLLAVFGTLIGIATVLSLIALLINIDRRNHAGLGKGWKDGATAPSVSAHAAEAPALPAVPKRARHKVPGPWRIADSKGDPRLRVIEGKVGTDPFIKAMTATGVQEREAYRVLTSMKGVRDFDKCAKSDRFSALVDRSSSRLKAFEYTVGPEEIYQAREGDDGLLKGSKLDLKVERNQVTGALVYDGKSFDASAEQAGFDPGLGHVVALALQGHLAMDELERGDRLRLIGQEVTVLGEFARYTGIEAIEVVHANPKRETLRVYYFDDPNLRGYYDRSGNCPYEGGWRKPIPGAAITSPFNPRRMHPILHKIMPHLGTDIGAPMGTPVGAAGPGTVSYLGPGGAAGNLLKLLHADGIETGYAHLSRYVAGIKVGDKVRRMQTIGYVGSTGRSTGPHLHFSAQRDGKFFDAESLNLDGVRVLNPEQRDQFAGVVAKYNPLLDSIPLPAPLPLAAPEPAPEASASAVAAAPAAAAADSAANDPVPEPLESAPVPQAPNGAPPEPAAKGAAGSVYLSDKELLKLQSATDEGEVAE